MPVIGKVSGDTFYARKRLSPGVRNSFQPRLTAKVNAEAAGSAIHCSFALHPLVIGFIALWAGFVLVIGGSIGLSQAARGDWGGLAIPGGMIVFVSVLTSGGWWLAAGDQEYLLAFVRRRTQADGNLALKDI